MWRQMQSPWRTCYWKYLVLDKPYLTILFSMALVAVALFFVPELRFNISADSLVLESDRELDYYRSIRTRYGSDDFVILTYNPAQELFSERTLKQLKELQSQVEKIDGIEKVTSILNAPLFRSPPVSIEKLNNELPTLLSDKVDLSLAKKELTESPLYRNQIISRDGDIAALIIHLKLSDQYISLLERQAKILEKQIDGVLTSSEKDKLQRLDDKLEELNTKDLERNSLIVKRIRKIANKYKGESKINLGGLPVIVSDMMRFVNNDLVLFGSSVVFLVCLILYIIFGSFSWVLGQLITALSCAIITTGFLAVVSWPVTVISSSFFSLLLIFTTSLTIHLLVKYQEVAARSEVNSKHDIITATVSEKFSPCFWTVLTTSVAFSSLVVAEVGPVIDFGWTMVVGLWVALLLCFTLFPAILVLLPGVQRSEVSLMGQKGAERLGNFGLDHSKLVLVSALILLLATSWGVAQLSLENRFLDYFRESTEIHKSTYVIDTQFGGTMPLDIILNAPRDYEPIEPIDDPFDDSSETSITETAYWLNSFLLSDVKQIHQFIESFQEIGKVISIATPLEIVEILNEGKPLETFELALLLKRLGPKTEKILVTPYVGPEGNQLRIAARVHETNRGLTRRKLVDSIKSGLTEKYSLKKEQVHFTGLFVLYNNMIESLFRSQILTLGTVFTAIFLLFIFAFRSFKLAFIAIIPNGFTATVVLGLMGLADIPLNFMTVTIAAVTIGIAVDDTIHYIHRFLQEGQNRRSTRQRILAVHSTIGLACFCTTITVALGFSALFLSSFLPTVYFGLLTGVAMLTAFFADMVILPALLSRV